MKLKLFNNDKVIAVILLMHFFAVTSCKRDNIGNGNGKASVVLNVMGIAEDPEISTEKTSLTSKIMATPVAKFVSEIPYNNKEYNIVTTLIPRESSSNNSAAIKITPTPPTQTSFYAGFKLMHKYRVMVFDQTGKRINGLEKTYDKLSQAKPEDNILLEDGTYTFVAVSQNSIDDLPPFNPSASTLDDVTNTISVGENTDYLYFNSGPVKIVSGTPNYLNIVFKHVNSVIYFQVNVAPELAKIKRITGQIGVNKNGGIVSLAINGQMTVVNGTKSGYIAGVGGSENADTRSYLSREHIVSPGNSGISVWITSLSLDDGGAERSLPIIEIPDNLLKSGVAYTVKLDIKARS